jgi:Mn2+/Fe2+ NRAMP family transporter
MGVHFLFLWQLFSGDWAGRVHGVRDFVVEIVIATALWVPLVVLFIARGASVTFEFAEPALRRALRLSPRAVAKSTLSPAETVLFGLYLRIFIMQLTIILGAWIAVMTGTIVAYVFLVAIKTAIDLLFQAYADELNAAWVRAMARAKEPA